MDYFSYVPDVHITHKFFYLTAPRKLSQFRLTRFCVSFYFDPRLHNAGFYGTCLILDQTLSKRFHISKMHRYILSSSIRYNQIVGGSSSVSGVQALCAFYDFLQYSLVRVAYGLVFLGPARVKDLPGYVFRTGFNRVLFLFNLSADYKSFSSIYDMPLYGFDISVVFHDCNIYTNKVILSHYGYPLL